jgi:rhodanese-related sulfurtransferase
LDKQYLPYLAAILFAFLIVAPGIAAAEDSTYTDVSVSEAKKMIEEGNVFILDVRTPAEFEAAHIREAVSIPFKNVPSHDPVELPSSGLLPARINEVPTDKAVIVYCLTGGRSLSASKLLVENGYTNVYNVNGGITAWIDAGYPVKSTFLDNSGIKGFIKKPLKKQIKCALLYLRMGDDLKANEQLDEFVSSVNKTEETKAIDSNQANYLRAEAKEIKSMI